MFIFKNALRCISRSKGRNILIGIIALVIAVSACIGLSIRQAAENAKEETLEGMSVTATISFDRQSMMSGMGNTEGNSDTGSRGGGFDKGQFAEMMGDASSLTLEEYQSYAQAESVDDFYYTLTASFNGSDNLEPVSTDTETETTDDSSGEDADESSTEDATEASTETTTETATEAVDAIDNFSDRQRGGMMGEMMDSSDFTVVGYSNDTAMTDFTSGIASITNGAVFDEGTSDYSCIISEELATYNDLAVGDVITITNPNSDTETYDLTIVGLYTSSQSNEFSMSMGGANQDPANRIYMSAAALQLILDDSESVSTTVTDEDTGREYETAVNGTLSATYVFANAEDYYNFEQEVRTLGLDDSYTVSSADITSFENSMTPLNTLSSMAGWFLVVILIIGAVILIVLNIFNVRERKYEIGVLTAMGMKKGKVALQFMTEILVVTMVAIIIGAGIGAVSSVPVTNALLANQIESQQTQQTQIQDNFGRPGNMGGNMRGGMDDGTESEMEIQNIDGKGGDNPFDQMLGGAADYISEIDSAMNLTVVLQMLAIGLLLTLAASAVSTLFVMRYDPLKILANRD